MTINDREAFEQWYTKLGWRKLSWNVYYRPGESGSEKWLYGLYLMQTA